MSDLEFLLAAVWVIYFVDGTRWSRDETNALTGASGAGAQLRRDRLHWPWPTPWSWRVRVDEPSLSLSAGGLSTVPARSVFTPASPAPSSTFLPWAALRHVEEKKGRLYLNGIDFGPADPFVSTEWIRTHFATVAALPPAERADFLERKVRHDLSPASWRRCWNLVLRATRGVALWHSFTGLGSLATTALLIAPTLGLPDKLATQTGSWVLPLAAFTAATFVGGIVSGIRAARRLRRWLPLGTVSALVLGSLYPPQGLRWRLRLMERAMPPTHPIVAALATLPSSEAAPWLRRALVLWSAPSKSACEAQDRTAREWSLALRQRLEALLASRQISLPSLQAPPPRDSRSSVAYCPSCHAQFVRLEATCACGLPLRPFVPEAPAGA